MNEEPWSKTLKLYHEEFNEGTKETKKVKVVEEDSDYGDDNAMINL